MFGKSATAILHEYVSASRCRLHTKNEETKKGVNLDIPNASTTSCNSVTYVRPLV